MKGRDTAPVFVVGCPRSGTTLLYDMLLSSGGFAIYPAESNVFNLLGPRFGKLTRPHNRKRLVDVWLQSKLFRASGLDSDSLKMRLRKEATSPAEFLRVFMDEMVKKQGVVRWADNSPEELLHIPVIKNGLPEALFIHIIRDGRDVAQSLLSRNTFLRPAPWKRKESFLGAGLYWEWIVTKGREYGLQQGADYTEVRFEELVASPEQVLSALGKFLDHSLSYHQILQVGLGSVSNPNTSFRGELGKKMFSPVGRWKQVPKPELSDFEALLGDFLQALGYPLSGYGEPHNSISRLKLERAAYRGFFDLKFRFKNSALARILRPALSAQTLDEIVVAEDWSGQPKR